MDQSSNSDCEMNKVPPPEGDETKMNAHELKKSLIKILAIAGDIITIVSWLADILKR